MLLGVGAKRPIVTFEGGASAAKEIPGGGTTKRAK